MAAFSQADEETPAKKQVHVIADNSCMRKHARVQEWLRRHKRFHVHFTPTGASWLNMVERFFRDLTDKRIRRGTFRSVGKLVKAIHDYLANRHQEPKPFIWTVKASDILQKVKRAQSPQNQP